MCGVRVVGYPLVALPLVHYEGVAVVGWWVCCGGGVA